MKLFVAVFLVVAVACQAAVPQRRGIVSDVADALHKILNRETDFQIKIQEKIAEIQDTVNGIIQWYEDLKEQTHPQQPLQWYVDQLVQKLVQELTKIANAIFDEVAGFIESALTELDNLLTRIFGKNGFTEAIYNYLDKILTKYIDMIVSALKAALKLVETVDGIDWSGVIDGVVQSVEDSLNARLRELRDAIKEKLGLQFTGTSRVHSRASPFMGGVMFSIKGFIEKILNRETWLQEKMNELYNNVNGLVEDIKNWRENLKAETDPQLPMEHYAEKLQKQLLEAITSFVDAVFDEVVADLRIVIDAIDAILDKIFGAGGVKDQIFQTLDDMITSMVETTMNVVRKILDLLNKIEGYDWSGFIDHAIETVRTMIDEKLSGIRQSIREKILG